MATLNLEETYHLRDIETKEIFLKFRIIGAAFEYQRGMRFGLSRFYEVYDSNSNSVIEDYKNNFKVKKKRYRIHDKKKEWVGW